MLYLVGSNLNFDGVKTLILNEINFYKFSVDLSCFNALVITSKNSINALKFNEILADKRVQIYAIGDGSAKAAKKFGFEKIYTAKNAHGDEFAREIAPMIKDKKALFLRAKQTASKVGEILMQSGVNLSQIIAYENTAKIVDISLKPPKNSIVVFTAPSAVKNFILNFGWDDSYKAISIGETTGDELKNFTIPIVSDRQNISYCLELAKTLL